MTRTRRLLGVLSVPLTVLAVVATLFVVEGKADSARTQSELVVEAELSLSELHAFLLARVAQDALPGQPPGSDELDALIGAATGSFASLDMGSAQGRFDSYLVVASRVWELHAAGESGSAAGREADQLLAAFEAVHTSLRDAMEGLEEQAESAEFWRDHGSIAALVLGGMFLLWKFRRAERVRRRLIASQAREAALQETELRFESLMSRSSDLVTVLDREGMVTFQSSSIEQMLGWNADDVVGHHIQGFVADEDVATLLAVLEQSGSRPDSHRAVDLRMRHASGEMVAVEAVVVDGFDDPHISGCLLNIRDQRERLVFEEALRHQAFHDPLTSLPNRALFEDRLAHALDRTARGGHSLCLLLADLDDFKDINDTYGHALGDVVLIEVAKRLSHAARAEDTVARLGGDEFAILLEEAEGEDVASRAAERIVEALAAPIILGDVEVFAHASIGIVLGSANEDGTTSTTEQQTGKLMIDADLAMYEAKRQGRGGFQFYAASMQQGIKERMAMRSDLERGLARGEFLLHYQPIIDIDTEAVVGAEALIRWQHPERGLVPPLDFIPLAERTGLILEIGRWVLTEACREAQGWDVPAEGRRAPYVSVNVAASQLQQAGFVQDVRDILQETGLSPSRLVVEVTESALIEDTDGNVLKLKELREVGIRLAIDDFGTGYSSLSYLRQFNLDILKIDKSFIDALGHDPKGSALVAAMVAMGTSLDMEVVAEGIEHRAQLDDLHRLRCDLGQGYLFARPVPATDLPALFRRGTVRTAAGMAGI